MTPIEKLENYINNENRSVYKNYKLENIKKLVSALDNPEKKIHTVHVAGTNGKGSTALYLNSILIKSKYKTGLYSSPHLLSINERIKINNIDISDTEFYFYIDKIIYIIENNSNIVPTFFDILTAIAFAYFADNSVDIAIIETGLGGRLDSTNIITPLISIITDISLDHTNLLGNSLKSISNEKAGIIKKNTPVITSNDKTEIIEIISGIAKEKAAPFYTVNNFDSINNIKIKNEHIEYDLKISFNSNLNPIKKIKIPAKAEYQIKNSALAIASAIILKKIFPGITQNRIKSGIKSFKIPGRFEIISKTPLMIFDPAHNLAAIESLISLIKTEYKKKKIILIFTLMKDKNYNEIISKFNEISESLIYYNIDDIRSLEIKNLKKFEIKIIETIDNLKKIISVKNNSNTLFLVTGSFRLYEIVKNIL